LQKTYDVSGGIQGSRQVLTASARNRNVVSPSDELFFLLEGQIVTSRSGSWRVEVCGVYSTDTDRWVQLNLAGPYRCGVTLRAGFRESSAVVDLLVGWLDDALSADLEPCIVSQASRPDAWWLRADPQSSPTFVM
jgi:hypothetical protein